MEDYRDNSVVLANLAPATQEKIIAFQQELDDSFEGYERHVVEEALLLMCEVHADQKERADGTSYVEHPLEVARKVLHSLENPDLEVVVGALLHDSVEDQAKKLAEKRSVWTGNAELVEEVALGYIEDRFGQRVRKIVTSLTNPDFEDQLTETGLPITTENKNRLYAQHVAEAIEDPDVLPIKLFDFSENGLRLGQLADPERRLKLSRKYAPVADIFIKRLMRGQHNLKAEVVNRLVAQLKDARNQMLAYIDNVQPTGD